MARVSLRLMLAGLVAAALVPGVAGLALDAAPAPRVAAEAAAPADAVLPCTNSIDCYVACVLGNPLAPLIYYQCLTWDFLPRIRCYLDTEHDPVCPSPLDPPRDP